MNKITWTIFALVTVGILALLIIFSGNSKVDVSTIDANTIQTASSQNGNIGDNVFGKRDSKVTLIEYADYQCPGCAGLHPLVKSIVEQYKDEIQFVYRNFPLSYHQNALVSAASAEAAGLQGKFWEMHDKIYETQDSWKDLLIADRGKFFEKLADELGLDIDKFKNDLANKSADFSVNKKINFDLNIGKKAGVSGTPNFFLNGEKLEEDQFKNEAAFKKTLDTALKEAGIPIPTQ